MRGVGQDDHLLDRRNAIDDLLDERHEGEIDEKDSVFGIVDDPDDLIDEEARVDGVIDRPDAERAVPDFQMPPGILGKRRATIAQFNAIAREPLRDFERAPAQRAIVGAMDRPLDRTRYDLPLRMPDGGVIDNLRTQKRPVLHVTLHCVLLSCRDLTSHLHSKMSPGTAEVQSSDG
jgi:hypothetical protein